MDVWVGMQRCGSVGGCILGEGGYAYGGVWVVSM